MLDLSHAAPAPSRPKSIADLPAQIGQSLARFVDRLVERFPGQIQRVILYGSFARGEAGSESDVDVMIVIAGGGQVDAFDDPRWNTISSLAFDATLDCGRYVSPLVVSERHFKRGSPVIDEAQRDGHDLLTAISDMGLR